MNVSEMPQDVELPEGSTIESINESVAVEAALLPETCENFLPKSEKFFLYNHPIEESQFRDPKSNLLTEGERVDYEQMVDLDRIKNEAKEWKSYVGEKIKENEVVLLGETHCDQTRTSFVDLLEVAKKNGVTDLGLEMEEQYQKDYDHFLENGTFREGDDPQDYENLFSYHEQLRKEENPDHRTMEEGMGIERRLIRLGDLNFDKNYPLLKESRNLGLRVRCLDKNTVHLPSEKRKEMGEAGYSEWLNKEESDREVKMYYNIKDSLRGGSKKMLAINGVDHVASNRAGRRNLRELLSRDGFLKSCGVNVDVDINEEPSVIRDKEEIEGPMGEKTDSNSVLYSVLEKERINNVGFDLNPQIIKNGVPVEIPFDGYVKI